MGNTRNSCQQPSSSPMRNTSDCWLMCNIDAWPSTHGLSLLHTVSLDVCGAPPSRHRKPRTNAIVSPRASRHLFTSCFVTFPQLSFLCLFTCWSDLSIACGQLHAGPSDCQCNAVSYRCPGAHLYCSQPFQCSNKENGELQHYGSVIWSLPTSPCFSHQSLPLYLSFLLFCSSSISLSHPLPPPHLPPLSLFHHLALPLSHPPSFSLHLSLHCFWPPHRIASLSIWCSEYSFYPSMKMLLHSLASASSFALRCTQTSLKATSFCFNDNISAGCSWQEVPFPVSDNTKSKGRLTGK